MIPLIPPPSMLSTVIRFPYVGGWIGLNVSPIGEEIEQECVGINLEVIYVLKEREGLYRF